MNILELTEKELKDFFNKYNLIELNAMNIIFGYVHEYDINKITEVASIVYKEKEKECYDNYEVPVKPYGFSLLNILDKNSKLNDKELNFLYQLVKDASFYLSSINDYQNEYEQAIEDFDIADYPIQIINRLEASLYNEINNRNQSNKTFVKVLV